MHTACKLSLHCSRFITSHDSSRISLRRDTTYFSIRCHHVGDMTLREFMLAHLHTVRLPSPCCPMQWCTPHRILSLMEKRVNFRLVHDAKTRSDIARKKERGRGGGGPLCLPPPRTSATRFPRVPVTCVIEKINTPQSQFCLHIVVKRRKLWHNDSFTSTHTVLNPSTITLKTLRQ